MEVVSDPNLVVVDLEPCGSSGEAHIGKGGCIYTTRGCHDMVPIQCLTELAGLHQHQHLTQLQPLQYPQVQVSYDSGLHHFAGSPPPFLSPLAPQPLHVLEPAALLNELPKSNSQPLELPQQTTTTSDCKYPADDFNYYKEIENLLLTDELPPGSSESYAANLKARAKHYLVVNGVLYHNQKNPRRVIGTKEEQLELLQTAHLAPETGVHRGIKKMFAILQERCFWRGMYVDVGNFVKKCLRCRDTAHQPDSTSGRKINGDEGRVTTISSQTISLIWNNVDISVEGPFNSTSGGNRYIVAVTDPVSRFIIGAPIGQLEQTGELTQFVLHTFYAFGFPNSSVNVPSDLVDIVKNELSWASEQRTRPLKVCERTNDVSLAWVSQLVAILVKKFPSRWDEELDRFLYQFRTGGVKQFGERLNSTPFYAMFNRTDNHDQHVMNKENVEATPEKSRARGFIWRCDQCEETFTSEVSYRFHEKLHQPSETTEMDMSDGEESTVYNFVEDAADDSENCVESTVSAVKALLKVTKNERRKRGKYQKYSVGLQLRMAAYALKFGSSRAAEHFSECLGSPVSESTIRNILKPHNQFSPSVREEIANFALSHGIDSASSHFSKTLKMNVSSRLVLRFKALYSSKEAQRSDPASDDSVLKLENDVEVGGGLSEGSPSRSEQVGCATSAQFAPSPNESFLQPEALEQLPSSPASGLKYPSEIPTEKQRSNTKWTNNLIIDPDLLGNRKLGKTRTKTKRPCGKKRGSYSTHSPELRAEIGKYAAEHGSLNASNHFGKVLGCDVAESTARALKQKYLQKVKHSDVTSLGFSARGRPLRLGKYDELVQNCLRELFRSGEKVTSFLAITTAKEVLNKNEPELLQENGGAVVLNKSWAKSFLKRIGVRNNS